MKAKITCIGLLLIFVSQVSLSQEVRFRSLNDVVFEFYKPWTKGEQLNSPISAPLLREDIDLFVRTIEEIGVDPYFNYSKNIFHDEINLLKAKIDKPLTRKEFLLLFIPLVNKLRLSHTYIARDYWFDQESYDQKGGKYFPVQINIENYRIFVKNDFPSQHLLEGDEIVSINKIQSRELINTILKYSNGSTILSKLMDAQNHFSSWLWWIYDFGDRFAVQTTKGNHVIPGMTSVELDQLRGKKPNPEKNEDNKQYEYTRLDADTGKLTFRHFGMRDTESFKLFLDSTFKQLKTNSIQNLIIDVRGNAGGSDNVGIEIVKYLYGKPFKAYSKIFYKKSKRAEDFFLRFLYPEDRNNPIMRKAVFQPNDSCMKEHKYGESFECLLEINEPKPESVRFKGNVVVLSDYKVISAGAVFVGLIKDYNIGRIVGTETEQSTSNDGNGCYFLLPHSNVMAMGSTEYYIRPNGDPSTLRGVLPDYEINQLKADLENGKDTVMDFAMKMMHERKNKGKIWY